MTRALWLRVKLVAGLVLVMIAVHIANIALGGQLSQYGIIPRSVDSWFHVFTAPFIHGNIAHLLNNVVGLSVFSAFCLMRSMRFYIVSSLFIIVASGGLIWLFGRDATHIGASGWIFGLWSLTMAIAWFDRRFVNIITAIIVAFFYGGMIHGVLPSDPRISFEAHLFGAFAGVVCAMFAAVFAKKE